MSDNTAEQATKAAVEAIVEMTANYGSLGEDEDWGFAPIDGPSAVRTMTAEGYDDDGEIDGRYVLTITAKRVDQ